MLKNYYHNMLINILRKIRSVLMRVLIPSSRYFLAVRDVKPISTKFGFDRGTPIDRYYIEQFMSQNSHLVKGHCLEIVENTYTKKYGRGKVVSSDILDNNQKNRNATIVADLRDLDSLPKNKYDCLIITQTFGMIDEYEKAIRECRKILKKGGALLATVSFFSPILEKGSLWRFTPQGAELIFSKIFGERNVEVSTFGNVMSSQCFWVGMATEELTKKELDHNDPRFPCIITIKAINNEKN